MKLYFHSTRNSQDCYTSYEGMAEEVARSLMEAIGHSSIESITEQTYLTAVQAEE